MIMPLNIQEIADKADMIINGYAFTKDENCIRVLNLDRINHAAVILSDEIVETNMDDIESQIVLDYYQNNNKTHFPQNGESPENL